MIFPMFLYDAYLLSLSHLNFNHSIYYYNYDYYYYLVLVYSSTVSLLLKKVPLTGIWQSFTPSLAGNLTRLEVLLGQAKPGNCFNMFGIFHIPLIEKGNVL